MTTYVNFQPNPNSAFQFSATLDGTQYTIIVTWNVYRQDYYINIFDLSGNDILTEALVGSPPDYDINLISILPLVFTTSTLVFRVQTQQFEINP